MTIPLPHYVNLERRFYTLSERELAEPDYLAQLNNDFLVSGSSWDEILGAPRVVILADGGAGKTWEMIAAHNRKLKAAACSFFLPIEHLKDHGLAALLEQADQDRYQAWQKSTDEKAWFFLDAVDELKLVQGSLEKALRLLSIELGPHKDRANIVLSSRPNDWDAAADLETFNRFFPPPRPKRIQLEPKEAFLRGLRRNTGAQADDDVLPPPPIKTAMLLPLSSDQIKRLAGHSEVENPQLFVDEIERRDAWMFARRPQDLLDTIDFWNEFGKIGRRSEHLAFNVQKKLTEPRRRGAGEHILDLDKAMYGAERLALALVLTRRRTLQDPVQRLHRSRREGVLNPAEILTDWTAEERLALLRLPLFSIATYGRIRFHHRSVQEYLAAKCLHRALENGQSRREVLQLIFAEQYGEQVVMPSMQAIAAWLALYVPSCLQLLQKRAPELLLSHGDPEALPLASRAAILEAHFGMQGTKDWNGIEIKQEAVKRIAHPELSDAVKAIWAEPPTNHETRELIASLIWHGPMPECKEITRALVMGQGETASTRLVAFRALKACGDTEGIEAFLARMQSDKFSARETRFLLPEVFADYLSVSDLVEFLERIAEPDLDRYDLSSTLRYCLTPLDMGSQKAARVRDDLAEEVLARIDPEKPLELLTVKAMALATMLGDLCDRWLKHHPELRPDEAALRAMAVACRFSEDDYSSSGTVQRIREHISKTPELREAAFWADVRLYLNLMPDDQKPRHNYGLREHNLSPSINQSDCDWLARSIAEDRPTMEKVMAFDELLIQWARRDRPVTDIGHFKQLAAGSQRLEALLTHWTKPNPQQEEWDRRERRSEKRKRIRQVRTCIWEHRQLEWREALLADIEGALSGDQRKGTLLRVYNWLQHVAPRDRYDNWDREQISEAFGETFTEAVEKNLREFWRTRTPRLLSETPKGERNTTQILDILGLIALNLESEYADWAQNLSSEDVEQALRYSTIELNGFAGHLDDLVEAHPDTVARVFGDELERQLQDPSFEHRAPLLQDISYGPDGLKTLMASVLMSHVSRLSADASKLIIDQDWKLKTALNILDSCLQEGERVSAARLCETGFNQDPDGALASTWLLGVFCFDPDLGCRTLTDALSTTQDIEQAKTRAERFFAFLFGNERELGAARLGTTDVETALLPLIEAAYTHVSVAQDRKKPRSYRPVQRDHAEQARSELIGQLRNRPGFESYRGLLRLAVHPGCAHFPDRLREMARERASEDAEDRPFSVQAAREISVGLPPIIETQKHLFSAFMGCLDDVIHDIEHGDFSDKALLARAAHESELQTSLSLRLENHQKSRFSITRESEAIEAKRTDIQAALPNGLKSVIEVKMAERHSGPSLFNDLDDQLIGRYLRHEDRRTGCFLLTCADQDRRWQLPDGQDGDFAALCAALRHRATELMVRERHSMDIVVKPLNLS